MSTTPRLRTLFLSSVLTLAMAGAAYAGPTTTYSEVGDAGDTVATAQTTYGAPLTISSIYGSLSGYTDVDLYLINITNFAAFSATTVNAGTDALLDTQIFLLTSTGHAVCLNDDDAGDPNFYRSTLGVGSCGSAAPGTYILGISSGLFTPVDENNALLFQNTGSSVDVRIAASQLALGGFFDGGGFQDNAGSYQIQLTGTDAAVIPEPTSALLVAGALAGCGWSSKRRQRKAAPAPVTA